MKNLNLVPYSFLATPLWIFNLENPAMLWANDPALYLWQAKDLSDLLKRDFNKSMTQTTLVRLQDYNQRLKQGETIKEQWTLYPNGEPVTVDCSLRHWSWDDKTDAMIVEVVSFHNQTHNDADKLSIEAVRHTSVAISQFNVAGELIFQNPISLALFKNQNISERIPSLNYTRDILGAIQNAHVFQQEIEVMTYEGKKWMYMTARTVTNPLSGNESILVDMQDISLQKEIEQELRKTEAKLVQSSKLASLGEMAGGLAHEINNPSAMIKLSAELILRHLSRDHNNDPKVNKLATNIIDHVHRITTIVEGLRTFSNEDKGNKVETYEIRELLATTLDLCRSKISSKGIDLRLKQFDGQIKITGQLIPLSHVLFNLINNSIDALDTINDSWIEVATNCTQSHVEISITDSGLGIPTATVEKLFNPFFTTKPIGEGTGLGLSVAKGIIADHQGDLIYNDQSNHTQFIICLPLYNQD